jgi:hypothetical protein
MKRTRCLASRDGVARVERCGHCDDLHITIGPLSFRISETAFGAFSETLQDAKAQLALETFTQDSKPAIRVPNSFTPN